MLNVRQALRSLFGPPLITAVAILSLALGVGANAAIFTLFEQLVLRPLPVHQPEQLVNLRSPGPKMGSVSSSNAGDSSYIFSYPMYRDLERLAEDPERGLAGIAAHRSFGANLAFDGTTFGDDGMSVSGSYFPLLGLQPALGRLLGPEDDTVEGGHPQVVLSHRTWTTRFDANPAVLNQSLVVNGQPLTIVGVAPRGFEGTTLGRNPAIFVPISMRGVLTPRFDAFDNRMSYWIYVFGRLGDGTPIESATAAMNSSYRSIIQEVELPLQEGMGEDGKSRFAAKELLLEPGRGGQSSMRAEVTTPLLLLLGVTGFVLLIACANVANLLLAKSMNRASEIATRLSIGARRHQIVGQLLLESFLLAAMGATLGLAVAFWTLRGLQQLMPADALAEQILRLSPVTWIFLVVMAILTGLVGLFPALHSTRHDLVSAMRNQSGQVSRAKGANRFRYAMTTIQIALSTALLISAGLFTLSLLKTTEIDLGIKTDSLLTFSIAPELNGYEPTESRGLFERIDEEVEALAGVADVSSAMVPLISGDNWGTGVSVEGYVPGPDENVTTNYNEVGPGYFGTVGIPLLAGRDFTDSDDLNSPKVAIVNQEFAERFGLGRNAVGKFISTSTGDAVELDIEIVGLVKNANYSDVKQEAPSQMFLPHNQNEDLGFMNFYVRTQGEPEALMSSIRTVTSRLDPNLPVEGLHTMDHQVSEMLVLERVLSTLSGAFAVLATILAAIGLYGVLAYSVAQRRREIGLRMALGADSGNVWGMILKQVAWLTVPGALLGVAAAIGIGQVAKSLLYEVDGHDPTVFASATLTLLVVGLLAGLLPARRATQIDPMLVLRDD